MALDRIVKKAIPIRTITLALGILVALFIFITLVNRNFAITSAVQQPDSTFRIFPAFPATGKTDMVKVFWERF